MGIKNTKMSEEPELSSYIGKEYNDDIKKEIERVFAPNKITICDKDYFMLEHYIYDCIRCVIDDNKKITHIRFG